MDQPATKFAPCGDGCIMEGWQIRPPGSQDMPILAARLAHTIAISNALRRGGAVIGMRSFGVFARLRRFVA